MERREFFCSLITGGVVPKQRAERRNRRAHHANERAYHGPMQIPARIALIVAEHPTIKRTTDRHLVSRYAEGGWTWIFRCQIPESRAMIGEIVRTPEGNIRVHCWSAARPGEYRTPDSLLANNPARIDAERLPRPLSLPILPPLSCWEEIGLRGTDISASPDGKKDE